MWVNITTLAMKFPGGRAQGSLEFISDQLGLGKVEKSDKKTGATQKKQCLMCPGGGEDVVLWVNIISLHLTISVSFDIFKGLKSGLQ